MTNVNDSLNFNIAYGYDSFGRLTSKVFKDASLASKFTTSYTYSGYSSGGVDYTSAQLASITNGSSKIEYLYDANGNITSITEGGNVIQYFYDSLGQVIRENNQRDNKTFDWEYDFGGNILSKKTYSYTTGSLTGLTPTSTDTYGYTNTNWKDQLTSFNGNTITYDKIGNPTAYNGRSFTWDKGRQLSAVSATGLAVSYTYNDSGIRTSKTVNGTTTTYHLNGDRVSYEKTGSVYNYYTYDSNGQLVSINYNGIEYYYIRNGQNDIIGLVDSTGAIVVNYTYSTWGEVLSTNGSLAPTLGTANPYRYRGYRFDSETGYYYLQSRYYNPGMGRFINADGIIGSKDEVLGVNNYTYCTNNPIKYSDPNGNWPNLNKLSLGLGLGCIGALAIMTALTVLTGGLALPAIITATSYVTLAAGAATATFGASEVIESLSGLNLAKKYIFDNNDDLYNDAVNICAAVSSLGTAIIQPYAGDAPKKAKYPGDDPTKAPSKDYEWRGSGTAESGKGNWYNSSADYSLHADLNHPEPIGPHWDLLTPEGEFRIYPNGDVIPKYPNK